MTASKPLFISRASADADFAAAVGDILESAGYTVILQQWDFANRNFMQQMHAALADGARVVAMLSPEYLRSDHCQAEWQSAIAGDPLNTKSRLIVLRVAECEPIGLLSALAYWDLLPVRENRALLQDLVLDAVREDRSRSVAAGPYWRAPRSILDAETIRPVPGFSGRETELAALATILSTPNAIAAVHGLGGVGKSSIAREYAWRNREHCSVIWWLNAESEDAIIDGLLRVGSLFVRGLDQHADRRTAAAQVIGSVLSGFEKPMLLIFDNIEDERHLHVWQPRSDARLLATSRNAAWGAGITPISLSAWSPEAALAYLLRESGRGDLTEGDARAIVDVLGALPLALSHAAASLRGMRMVSPALYLKRIGEYLKRAPRSSEYPHSVFATFSTAIANAEKESHGAAALLCFAACFAPDFIPDELFRQPVDLYTPPDLRSAVADSLALDEALGQLDRFSLLTYRLASRSYSIHRLVRRAALDSISKNERAWIASAIAVAEAAFPKVEFITWPECERLLPHVRAALDALPNDEMFLPAGRLATRCAIYLHDRADYAAAEPLHRRGIAILQSVLGPEATEVAVALRHLGMTCYYEGRYVEAESLALQSLEIVENSLGPDDINVAIVLSDLGVLHNKQGRYNEVEPCHLRALEITEKSLGRDHPEAGLILSNLGLFYEWQGRYDEAETALRRSLAIREKALGPNHPDVSTTLNNLGKLYYRVQRYKELEELLKRALSISENALGRDHPDVAHTLNNLGLVYLNQGRYAEAEQLNIRALRIRETSLGVDHPELAATLNSLARIYEAQGRYEEAEALHLRTLEIREKSMGPETTDTAASLKDLGSLYETMGRFDEALTLHERALAIREKAFGLQHEDVATSLHHLAKVHALKEHYAEAERLYARALAIREKTLGPDHALTQAVSDELNVLQSRG